MLLLKPNDLHKNKIGAEFKLTTETSEVARLPISISSPPPSVNGLPSTVITNNTANTIPLQTALEKAAWPMEPDAFLTLVICDSKSNAKMTDAAIVDSCYINHKPEQMTYNHNE